MATRSFAFGSSEFESFSGKHRGSNETKVDGLNARIARVKEAQARYAAFSQERVDRIFRAAATAANAARIDLAKQAVAETGMGIVIYCLGRAETKQQ